MEGLHHSLYHNVCGIILDMTRTAGLFTWVSELLLFNAKWAICQLFHCELHSRRWCCPLCTMTTHWLLAHWNNILWKSVSLHSDKSSWFRALSCCLRRRVAANANFIVDGFTRPCLEPIVYINRGKHAKPHTTDTVSVCFN